MTTIRQQRMSPVDTAWLRMDRPSSTMMIVGVTVTAGRIGLVQFRRLIERRLLRFERFRQRPLADALGANWVADREIDMDWHVRALRLPEPAGQAELQTVVGELAGTALDPSRPRWQMHLVERYGAGSAWILRVHHCYADGAAMVNVLLSLTEDARGMPLAGSVVPGPSRRRRRTGPATPSFAWLDSLPQLAGQAAAQASGLLGELANVLALPDDPPTPLRGVSAGIKRVAWAEPLALAEVRTVGKALGCTINDVLMATLTGALGSYLRERSGSDEDLRIRAAVPVNLRRAGEPLTLGNQFGMVFVELPVGLRNPLERLYAMHTTMTRLKGSLQPSMVLAVLGTLGLLPAPLQERAIELFSRKGSVVVSNVPGPHEAIYLCGQRVAEMYFWVPQAGSIGVGLSLLSYAGRVHVGAIADAALVPDPSELVNRVPAEFNRLAIAATTGVLARQARARSHKRRRSSPKSKRTPRSRSGQP